MINTKPQAQAQEIKIKHKREKYFRKKIFQPFHELLPLRINTPHTILTFSLLQDDFVKIYSKKPATSSSNLNGNLKSPQNINFSMNLSNEIQNKDYVSTYQASNRQQNEEIILRRSESFNFEENSGLESNDVDIFKKNQRKQNNQHTISTIKCAYNQFDEEKPSEMMK